MDLQTSLIDLDSIETIEENNFSVDPVKQAAEIKILAKTVINIKGLLRIPVVEQIGIESYKLISGHFDYYAYLKARELDSSLPDRIRVFIVNPKKEIAKGIIEQLEAINKLQLPSSLVTDPDDASFKILKQISNTVNFEIIQRLTKLEEKVSSSTSTSNTVETLRQLESNVKKFVNNISVDELKNNTDEIIQFIRKIENDLGEIRQVIKSSSLNTPILHDSDLGENLVIHLFENLASGKIEVIIRKPYHEIEPKKITIDNLKSRFSSINEAKEFYQVKANGWQSLADKLNSST